MIRQLTFAGICAMAVLTGCETSPTNPGGVPRTEGERTLAQARMMEQQGEMLVRGERLIADGEGLRARGQAMRDQGKVVDGERMIGEGDAKVREGQAVIDRAKSMPTEPRTFNESDGSTTRPAMNRTGTDRDMDRDTDR